MRLYIKTSNAERAEKFMWEGGMWDYTYRKLKLSKSKKEVGRRWVGPHLEITLAERAERGGGWEYTSIQLKPKE